jgi:hypothetical protein
MTTQADKKPTTEEKEVIAEYVRDLTARGFCKLDADGEDRTRLYNRYNHKTFSFAFIGNDFKNWLSKNKKVCKFREAGYIAYDLPHVVGSKFRPNKGDFYTEPKTGCLYINTYTSYEVTANPLPEVSPLFHEFLERLFPLPDQRKICVQWLAHMYQKPQERPSYHLLLTSDTGTGKGLLFSKILKPLLSNQAAIFPDYDSILGKHARVLEKNVLCQLDDPKTNSENIATQLKHVLSEEHILIEPKGEEAFTIDTVTRVIIATNEDRPIPVDSNERRLYAPVRLEHKESREETQAFLTKLVAWIDNTAGSLDALYNWFMSVDISDFNHKHCVQTPTLKTMIGLSTSPHVEFINHYAEGHKVFTLACIKEAMKNEGLTPPSDSRFIHLFLECKLEKKLRRIDDDGKKAIVIYPIGATTQYIKDNYPFKSF